MNLSSADGASFLLAQVRAFAGANKLGDPAGVAFYEVEKPAARHKEH